MNIDEFLSFRSADLPSVVANVEATIGLGAADVLLAVGSIVEGLGTSKSDLDLLLVTPRAKSSLPPREHVTLVVGRCLIDMRVLPWSELEELLARFGTWSRLSWNVTHAVKFTLEERTLLHRLLHSHVIRGGQRDQVMARLPARQDLARLKLHVARQMARTIQVDMVGYRETHDYRSLMFAAQEVCGQATDALLAAYGQTNALIKWRSQMLDLVPSDWARALAVRPTRLTAGEHVYRLHRAPERPDAEDALAHAFRIVAFARAVFAWAELRLVSGAVAELPPINWPLMERPASDSALPYLDFDVDFFFGDGRVTVARLNEFGEPIEMALREFAVALLFDGTTTAREAEFAVYGSPQDEAGSANVDRLVSRVVRAGFGFPPRGSSV